MKSLTEEGLQQQHMKDPIVPLVKERIADILASKETNMRNILDYIKQTNGKMVRPILVAMVFRLCNGTNIDYLIDAAAGIELVHNASLVHDDIIDKSNYRRSNLTVQKQYGAATAVLAGDFLFAKAFSLLAKNQYHRILAILSDTICQMCEGEVRQLIDPRKDETYYWQYIYNKTVCLIEAACCVGAVTAGEQDQNIVSRLSEFGKNIGFAFQLIDDLMDYSAAKSFMGKTPGQDYIQGLWTLPIIRGVKHHLFDEHWRDKLTFDQVKDTLCANGVLTDIKQEAENYVIDACALLSKFSHKKECDQLIKMAKYFVSRIDLDSNKMFEFT